MLISVGARLLDASAFEYARDDYSRSIVFSAMAVECQLADTYKKWAGARYEDTCNYDEAEVEKQLREWGTVRRRLEKVGEYLDKRGFEIFIEDHPHVRPIVMANYPTTLEVGRVIDGLESKVFWHRNRILHFGYDGSGQEDAKKAFNLAAFGLEIVKLLDRSMALEDARQASRERFTPD